MHARLNLYQQLYYLITFRLFWRFVSVLHFYFINQKNYHETIYGLFEVYSVF